MRKLISLTVTLLYLAVFLTEGSVSAAIPEMVPASISARSAILLDLQTNRILYAKKPNHTRPAASTTKLMTALVVVEKLSLHQVVRVPKSAEYIPSSKINLRAGERFYVKDLLRAVLISSANDAAYTLALACAGSEARFARMMNQKARKIGARHTLFVNASGLPKPSRQYTTAYDLALIMKEARRNRFIEETLGIKVTRIKALTGRTIYLRNHNKMLWKAPHRVEGKTGFTRRALHCFVGRIKAPRRGDILVAIMGSLRPWQDLLVLLGLTRRIDPFQMQFNRMNLSSKEVADVQRTLRRVGFLSLAVDGIFGPQTLKAVKAFQKARGLRADGIVGSRTWAKLKPLMRG